MLQPRGDARAAISRAQLWRAHEIASVQQGGDEEVCEQNDHGSVWRRGGRRAVRPPPALHLPCEHLLGYAHNGDGTVRSSSACLFRLRLQPAASGWGMATARRGAGGNAVPSFGSKHSSSHTTRAIRSAACPAQRSISGRAGDRPLIERWDGHAAERIARVVCDEECFDPNEGTALPPAPRRAVAMPQPLAAG